jgi:hypothetical protein
MPLGKKGFQKGVPAWSKGKHLTKVHKRRIGTANKGRERVITAEWRANMSKSRKGKKFSITHRKNLSRALRGPKSSGWRGGVYAEHRRLRHSVEYKLWREAVYKRDNWTCVFCGSRGGRLVADHIKPFAYYPELRFSIDNGRTLCDPCHRTTDTYASRARWKQRS